MKKTLFFLAIACFTLSNGQHGCKDSCSCPDLLSLDTFPENVLYSEGAGCIRNHTCWIGYATEIAILWEKSEIPPPDDAIDEYAFAGSDPDGNSKKLIDFFSYYGMTCENSSWFITKYPDGLTYFTKNDGGDVTFGAHGELDGKKGIISDILW